jgi:hypothetical protein
MSTLDVKLEDGKTAESKVAGTGTPNQKQVWETPKLEDVSEQVMAQPYIRFT